MKTVLKSILVLIVSISSLSAALVEADHPVFGPKSLTVDTTSQLGWLDLSSSANYSYLQAEAAMQSGGLFQGFRHATTEEVSSLYQHAGIFALGDYPENNTAIQSLIGLLGPTSFDDGHPEVIGISATAAIPTTRYVPMLDFYIQGSIEGNVPLYKASLQQLAFGEITAEPTVGNWLVMTVPEPGSGVVFGLGLSLLSFRRVKKIFSNKL